MRVPTLLILGAGSCFDFGFPLGPELVQNISDATRVKHDGFRISCNDEYILALLERLRIHDQSRFGRYLTACDYISRNVGYSSSIDNFLNSNQLDQDVVLIAKFAISSIISRCEQNSVLNVNDYMMVRYDAQELSNKWLSKLFSTVHAPIEESVEVIFQNLSVVSFNYDRVFEQYLAIALTNFYRILPSQARDLVARMGVSHVYGSLGSLIPATPNHAEFGTFNHDPETNAGRIKTFHESVDSEIVEDVRRKISQCERVFSLGFSYANINTGFLRECVPGDGEGRTVYGTCFKMSEQNVGVARQQMKSIFGRTSAATHLLPVTCERFFDDLALTV